MNHLPVYELEGEERYKDLFENAHDLIHITALDGTLLYVNPSWINALDYTQEEIQGKSFFSFLDPADVERFKNYRNTIINSLESSNQITFSIKTKTGKKITVEGFVSLKIKDGKPIYTRGIFRDITAKINNEAELKLSNEKLKEREYNLQQLLLYAPDAIVVIDAASKIMFWNPKAEEIFGWSLEEVQGATLTDKIIPPEYREAHEKGMKRFLQTGESHVLNKTIDITALNKKGDQFYISLTISTVRQGGETCFIAFIRDITKQKLNEIELEGKRKELESSNKELEQFAHVASHDMKEPIRKIKVFGSRIESEFADTLPDKANKYLQKILEAAERLTRMVEGVLNYSMINNNEDSVEAIDFTEIIEQIKNDLELLIQEKNASIQVNSCNQFQGIRFLIYQLFYNLINNSLKFTRDGIQPEIDITCKMINREEFSDRKFIEIILRDNGIGFDQEHAERIFNTFTRLNSKDAYEGTGLGLTLCKNIVERHHGSITAEGKPGEGSVFRIIIPEKQREI